MPINRLYIGILSAYLALQAMLAKPALPQSNANIRPNFLIIVSDDQRYGTVGEFMPQTQHEIFDRGVTFTNAFVTTSICCPSRASILTGQYASKHGVRNNSFPLKGESFIPRLKAAGYRTGIVGKYLNSSDGTPRAEFDYWVSFARGSADFVDPTLNVNGKWATEKGHLNTILTSYVEQFLSGVENKPFFLLYTPFAPHRPATPVAEDLKLYRDLALHRPPNYAVSHREGKPAWARKLDALAPKVAHSIDKFRITQLRSLASLDRSVGAILAKLGSKDLLKNTVIIYLSDNGVMWGEHGLSDKNLPYDGAVHVPFAVRYDALISNAREERGIVANIDIAPTLIDFAGLGELSNCEGQSLRPLLTNSNNKIDWREGIFLEGWPRKAPHFVGFRTAEYLYVETEEQKIPFVELYNLRVDPYQIENVATDPRFKELKAKFSAEVKRFESRPKNHRKL